MKKLVAMLACLALFAAVPNAGDLRLCFSASSTLGEVLAEFFTETNPVVGVGQPAPLA